MIRNPKAESEQSLLMQIVHKSLLVFSFHFHFSHFKLSLVSRLSPVAPVITMSLPHSLSTMSLPLLAYWWSTNALRQLNEAGFFFVLVLLQIFFFFFKFSVKFFFFFLDFSSKFVWHKNFEGIPGGIQALRAHVAELLILPKWNGRISKDLIK